MPSLYAVPKMKKPPKKSKGSRKLVLLLLLFFMIIMVVLFLRSSISKIASIRISGNHLVSSDQIGQASGIHKGDSFIFSPTDTMVEGIKKIPAVQSVRVSKRFPGTVLIQVEEYPVVAYELSPQGQMEMVLSNGVMMTDANNQIVMDKPLLSGWGDLTENKLKLCRTLEKISSPLLEDVSEIIPFPSQGFPGKIKIYTNSHFEIITTIDYLPKKIPYLQDYMTNHQPGVITMLLSDYYGPYQLYNKPGKNQSEEKR